MVIYIIMSQHDTEMHQDDTKNVIKNIIKNTVFYFCPSLGKFIIKSYMRF